MLVAAHVLEIALLLAVPAGVGVALASRWGLPRALVGMGLLGFVIAEVALLGAARAIYWGFEAGVLPMPTRDDATLVEGVVAAVVTAFVYEGSRVWVFVRYVDEHRAPRGAALVGLGYGVGTAGLAGLLVLGLSAVALFGEGSTMEELEGLGLSGRAAVKVGLRIYAWWEGSPWDALSAATLELVRVALQVALTGLVCFAVARKRWGFVALAFGLHLAANLVPVFAADVELLGLLGAGAVGLVVLVTTARRDGTQPDTSA